MAQQLTPQIMIRLVLVKQAYYKAVQSATEQTDIGNIFAIQQLDFSIETLLKTIVSHYGRPTSYNGPQSYYKHKLTQLTNEPYKPDSSFPRLFDEVVGIYRDQTKGINRDTPPLRQEIELIHDMRNDAQHNGVTPSSSELQRRIGLGESFIVSVLNEAFGLSFDQIMLANLINDTNVKNDFETCENALHNNNFADAITNASIAFARAMDIAYQKFLEFRELNPYLRYGFEQMGRDMIRAIEDLREEMRPIVLGVDPIGYLEFLRRSPNVDRTIDGTYHVSTRDNWNPTRDDAIAVLNFVFSSLMRWKV